MRPALHQHSGEADRSARGAYAGNRAGAPAAAVHDCRVELDLPFGGEDASAPGVEGRVVLEHADGGLDRIERAPSAAEDLGTGIERVAQALPRARLMIGIAVDG